MKKIYILLIAFVAGLSGCDDFLDRKNLDTLDDVNFWTSEGNMRLYAQGAYTRYFYGYGSGFAYGDFFTFGPWSDEYSSTSVWTQNTAPSSTSWTFAYVRRANIIIDRVEQLPVSDEAKNHWRGVGRFFRAMEYADLARQFGDVPWYDRELSPQEEELIYKPRDPLPYIAAKIMEDFQYAAENVRVDDGPQQINRDIVLAFMSRHLLYFGTFLKYHDIDQTFATTLLEKTKWAAEQLIEGGNYQIENDYRALFSSADLTNNKEVILFRQYETAKATHSLASYNNIHDAQTGTTLKMLETYLASDGLPIKQSPLYNYALDNGRRLYKDQYANRDPRLAATLVDSVKIQGAHSAHSTTGIACWKFLPYEANIVDQEYLGSTNVTDAPVIRYGEVLLNYAEAAAELGQFTTIEADKSINQLRGRAIKKNNQGAALDPLPDMVVDGNNVTVNGVVINDPDRDPTVSPLLWEIRRERAVELVYEGFRKDDLRRWKKLEYLKTKEEGGPSKLGLGAYVDLSVFSSAVRTQILSAVHFYYPDPGEPNKGFIHTLYDANMTRDWQPGVPFYERQYLNAVPIDQIKLYKDLGYDLTQNPGWETVD